MTRNSTWRSSREHRLDPSYTGTLNAAGLRGVLVWVLVPTLLAGLIFAGASWLTARLVNGAHERSIVRTAETMASTLITPHLRDDQLTDDGLNALVGFVDRGPDPVGGPYLDGLELYRDGRSLGLGLQVGEPITRPTRADLDAVEAAGVAVLPVDAIATVGALDPASRADDVVSVLLPLGDDLVAHLEFDAIAHQARIATDIDRGRRVLLVVTTLLVAIVVLLQRANDRRLRKRLHAAEMASLRDLTTEVGNERALRLHLDDASSQPGAVGLVVVQLKRFHDLNNGMGHDHGDAVLREAAARLRAISAVRGDRVFRLTGAKFAIVVPSPDPDTVTELALGVAAQADAALRAPFRASGLSIDMGSVMGAAFMPQHAHDGNSLIRRATASLRVALRDDQRLRVFDPADDRVHDDKLALGVPLRSALERDGLDLHFQPIVDADTRAIGSVEALARWRVDDEWISPGRFIPVAEELGLTSQLTRSVLRAAVTQAAEWRRRGTPVIVSVNIFPIDVMDDELPRFVSGVLARAGLPADLLRIEVTERTEISDLERAVAVLDGLRAVGVTLAIDDFGAGAWSLRHLHRLGVDVLKLDRSLVVAAEHSAGARSLFESVTALGRRMGMQVVAEGVEDEASIALAVACGVDLLQGFGIARPAPPEAIGALLRDASVGVAHGASTVPVRAVGSAPAVLAPPEQRHAG